MTGLCPRCLKTKIKKGKKSYPKEVMMREGMILDTCPVCGFQCREYDRTVNDPQPTIVFPTGLILGK